MQKTLPQGLLSREAFTHAVIARSGGRCVCCPQPAVDAHHILERKLFADGGYYLDNGAALCAVHHLAAEWTQLSCEMLRLAAGIETLRLPEGFDPSASYDKWGNRCHADGTRSPGPLFADTGCRRALASGGFLGIFVVEFPD